MSKFKGRPCGPTKSSKNPDAYTKPELVKLAVKKFKITESAANKMTKTDICKSLDKGKLSKSSDKTSSKKDTSQKEKKGNECSSYTVVELKNIAKEKGHKGYSKMKKDELCKLLKIKGDASKPKKETSKKPDSKKEDKPKRTTSKKPVSKKEVKPKKETSKPKKETSKSKKDAKETSKPKKGCIERSKLPLRDHQKKVVNLMRTGRGLVAAHEVGSGKTLTAVTASECFLEDYPNGRILVVTPVSLQDNFRKEMKAYGVTKTNMKRYEFYTLQGFANEYNEKSCASKERPVMLIIDEAHNLRTDVKAAQAAGRKRSLTSKSGKKPVIRSEVAIRCAKVATKVLLLTATSIYNEPYDLENLVSMVRGKDPLSKKEFYKTLNKNGKFNYDYFKGVFDFYAVPPDKDNYPDVKEEWVEIPMTKSYYNEYRKVENLNSEFFSETNPWRFLTGMRQASNVLKECPKCDWVLDKVKNGEKTVIYSAFLTNGVEHLQKEFKANNIPYSEVTGKMRKDDRSKAVKDYNTNKVDILFITKAGGEGLDLKGTRNVIIFESSWNRATEEQIIGRAVRFRSHTHLPKNERVVNVYHLLMVKPSWAKDELLAADSYLKELTEGKEKSNKYFIDRLKSA